MTRAFLALFLSCLVSSIAADCSFSNIRNVNCPKSFSKPPNYCADASLLGGSIIRCANGCPILNTCAEILLTTPPEGPKIDAVCWDEGEGGNAQCTLDCVKVTALNGTTFYPLGCKSLRIEGSGPSVTLGTDSTRLSQSGDSAASTATSKYIPLAPGPVVVSTSLESASGTETTTTTTGTASSTSGSGAIATTTPSSNAAVCIGVGMLKGPESVIGLIMMCMGIDYIWL